MGICKLYFFKGFSTKSGYGEGNGIQKLLIMFNHTNKDPERSKFQKWELYFIFYNYNHRYIYKKNMYKYICTNK